MYLCTYVHACTYMCVHIYIYIYVYMEREREIGLGATQRDPTPRNHISEVKIGLICLFC